MAIDISATVDSAATVENAGGEYSLVFQYISAVGKKTETLAIHVPIKHAQPSTNDKKALLEAVIAQGGLGQWIEKMTAPSGWYPPPTSSISPVARIMTTL